MLDSVRKWLYERMALNNMTEGIAGKAEYWYKKLEVITPDSLPVLHNLGIIYISLKKFTEAEKYLTREIILYGGSEIRYRVLGDLFYLSGEREKAVDSYKKALDLLGITDSNRSGELFLRRRIRQCREKSSYAKAMDGMKYYEEGVIQHSKGNFTKALELYNKALENDNSSFLSMNAAGTLLLNNLNDYKSAKNFFMKALELSDMPLIRSNLALAEHKLKERSNTI